MKKLFFTDLSLVMLIQVIILVYTFNNILFSPELYNFHDSYDGLKNYFTYYGYIRNLDSDLFKYDMMNYPFGEYIFYTDCTPLIALLVKFFSKYIWDVSEYAFGIFNYLIVFSFLISTWFIYKVSSLFINNRLLLILCSICLTWINPQVMRIIPGHLNLMLSFFIMGTVYFLVLYFKNYNDTWKYNLKYTIQLIAWIVLAGLFHAYYISILGVFAGAVLCVSSINRFFNLRSFVLRISTACFIPIFSVLLYILILVLTDGYFQYRGVDPGGYNWEYWKLNIMNFFSSYSFNALSFFGFRKQVSYESYAYLGSFALYGLSLLLATTIYNRVINNKNIIRGILKNKIIIWLFVGSLFSVSIALGESITISNGDKITNYFNLFYYISMFTDITHQFRCLGRFNWVFFWSFNLLVMILANVIISKSVLTMKYVITIMLCFFLLFDTYSFIDFLRSAFKKNVFNSEVLSEKFESVDFTKKYQAILPIPYYHIGSGSDYKYTLETADSWITKTMQLSAFTNLPLMSSKMARTPVSQAKSLLEIFVTPKINSNLLNRLDQRPILIMLNSELLNDKSSIPQQPFTKKVYFGSRNFVKQHKLKYLATTENVKYYEWEIDN